MEHERPDALSHETVDHHRALESLKEEIEAVDWYQQRATLAGDAELRRILVHNRNEEMEHACMILEWLRRNMPEWDGYMRRYLFSDAALADAEGVSHPPAQARFSAGLGIKVKRGSG